ncbi:MAG: sulfotransferase family protein [Planctomycetota bacterium]|jgi:hypothetical protein
MAKLAYIMGASHSGSTLLAMLLGSHPQATTVGDTGGTIDRKAFGYRCSCGREAAKCPFWRRIADNMGRRGLDLDVSDFGTRFRFPENRFIDRVLRAEYRGPVMEAVRDSLLWLSAGWRRQFRGIVERNIALVEAVTEVTDSQVLVDSSKLPLRLKFLLRIPALEVKVIHLVRDGRAVAQTYIEHHGWSVMKSAIEWRRDVLEEEELLARLGRERWLQVRYEDLCSDPQGQLEKLCVFLNMDPARVNVDFRSAGLHVFGNGMRLSSEPRILLDDKWLTALTDAEISTIERLAGAELKKYGYACDGGKKHRDVGTVSR